MTDEEMRMMMESIIEQQVQFAVNLGMLREAQHRTELHLAEVAAAQAETARAQTHMARSQVHLNEVVAVMAEAQERTDDRLNTLIDVVERQISEGRDGSSK
jgi:hypothetical protein